MSTDTDHLRELGTAVGHRHKWVRNGRFADPSQDYGSPVCLICGTPDPRLRRHPDLLDELDALRAVAEAARALVAAEDRWMAEIDPEVGPPSIEPLVAALARLDQQGGEK